VGDSRIYSICDQQILSSTGPFDRQSCDPKSIAQLLIAAALGLDDEQQRSKVSSQIVFAIQSEQTNTKRRENAWGPDDSDPDEKKEEPPQDERFSLNDIRETLCKDARDLFHASVLHNTRTSDVLLGADALATMPELLRSFEVVSTETPCWEWRQLIDGEWRRLPEYISGVLEGALRDGRKHAAVQTHSFHSPVYFYADLESFTARMGSLLGAFMREDDPERLQNCTSKRKLTRFLRGCPSSEPDRRSPEDMARLFQPTEVVEVPCAPGDDTLTVSTLTGKVVFSVLKMDVRHATVADVLEEVSSNLHKKVQQLKLLGDDGTLLETAAMLKDFMAPIGKSTLQVIAQELPSEKHAEKTRVNEVIPEDVPGEQADIVTPRRCRDF
jgi:hypothetical protein